MYSLTYTSTAQARFTRSELLELSTRAREKNARLGITGLLLYKDGYFMQVIEGERALVAALFEAIQQDPRHRRVEVIHQGGLKERRFPNWSMATFNLNEHYVDYLPGYSEYLDVPLTHELFKRNPAHANQLLSAFNRPWTTRI